MADEITRPSTPRTAPGEAALPPATPTRDPACTAADGRLPDGTRTAERAPTSLPPGVVVIPGYEVRGEIARGGMGRVLAARDLAFGREVAIKVVLPGPDTSTTAGRFVRESRITGRLTHPGIPPAYQLGELTDGSPFLAMKLVRGRTLAALLAERPEVGHDLPRFVAVFEQVCLAVGYAHSEGVIHRDLKPANIMVGAFGEVQVMDWGLARDSRAGTPDPTPGSSFPVSRPTTGSTVGDDRTQAGAVMGTPAYMAPEQARGEDVDARTDVFALGGLLTSILVGRAPFRSGDVNSTLVLASAGDTSEVLAALDTCSADADLVDIARRCLAPERAGRPADGTAVAGVVAEYRAGVEQRLRTAERDRAAAEARTAEEANTRREAESKVAEQRRKRRAQLATAVTAVLLVAGAGGVAVWRVDEDGKKRAEATRLEGEEKQRRQADRDRKERAADAVAVLLDQAGAGLAAGEADRAEPFLDQADRRASDDAVADHADRAKAYRTDLAVLRELDRVDDIRWTMEGSHFPTPAATARRWLGAVAAWGVDPRTTPPAAAAARVAASPVRVRLLAALDGVLARSGEDLAAFVRPVLDAADPDPFRTEVRRLLAAADPAGLAAVPGRDEWHDQPPGLILAYTASRAVPRGTAKDILIRAVGRRPDDFGLLMELGAEYPVDTADGAGDRARWFQAAVALRPRSGPAHGNLGNALADLGDLPRALTALESAVRFAPGSAASHSNLGQARRRIGDLDGAIAAYREAIRLDPKHAVPHNNIGNALRDKGELAAAEAAFREAIRLDPEYPNAHSNLGRVLREKGDTRGAVAAHREGVRLDPKDSHRHTGLGIALQEKGELVEAEAAFREAIRLDPKDPLPHNQLGIMHRVKGEPVEAEAAFREAIRLDPKSGRPYYGLGIMLQKRGDLDGAVTAYREAIRLDPKHANPHNNLGGILWGRKDLDGAIASFREAIRLDPKYALPQNGLGNALSDKGDTAGAVAAYREAIRLQPNYALPYNGLGHVLIDSGDPAGAAAAFREAIRLDPKNPRPRVGLGAALRALGDPDAAADAYRSATRAAPEFAAAHVGLGDVLRGLGRADEAATAYRAALAADPDFEPAREGMSYLTRLRRGQVPTAPPPRAVAR